MLRLDEVIDEEHLSNPSKQMIRGGISTEEKIDVFTLCTRLILSISHRFDEGGYTVVPNGNITTSPYDVPTAR